MNNESAAQRAAEKIGGARHGCDCSTCQYTIDKNAVIIEAEFAAERAQWEAERKQLIEQLEASERERLACKGNIKTALSVLQAAGVPCFFGDSGLPTMDEKGCPRDLADCVRNLVGERDFLNEQIDHLRATPDATSEES